MFIILSPIAVQAQDSLTIHFEGVFEKSTMYLMIYRNDTVCIQVNSGAFTSYYKVELSANYQTYELLPMSIWYITSEKRKRHIYKDSGLKVFKKGGNDLWISNEVYNTETYVVIRKNEHLDYYW